MIETEHGTFEIIKDYKEALEILAFNERYVAFLNKYVYIVGDYSADMLRLKGFTESNFETIPDYLIYYELITTVPLVEITDIINDIFEVNFTVGLDDQFGILSDEILTLNVYDEFDVLLAPSQYLIGSGTIDVLNFLNDSAYRIEVLANVSGLGSVLIHDQVLDIPARVLQDLTWTSIVVTGTTVSTDVTITLPDDVNQVIQGSATVDAVLYDFTGGVMTEVARQTALVDGLNTISFNVDGTDSTPYVIVIEGTCNFNDGLGDQLAYAISTRTFVYIP